jgi:hypothetical protein
MGVDFGDYDNGDMDLIITNFSEDYDTPSQRGRRQVHRRLVYRHHEVTWPYRMGSAIRRSRPDLPDIVIANRHVYPEVDKYDREPK